MYLKKIIHYLKKNKILVGVLLLGLFLRVDRPLALFMYGHDHDLLAWFVKDVVVNHNLRLIGQETSVIGVFIGPLFYYLCIPFFVLWGMSPAGGIALVTIIGGITIASVYYVFEKMFGRRVAVIGMLLYAVSFYTVMTDREVVPTTPVLLWSVWFLYALHAFLESKTKQALLVSAVLIGLIWHLNLALILVTPLLPLAFFMSSQKVRIKDLILPAILLSVLVAPLVLFEVRHNFSQVHAITSQFGQKSAVSTSIFAKFDRVIQLFEKDLGAVWSTSLFNIPRRPVLYLLPIVFVGLLYFKRISRKVGILLLLWVILFLIFFTLNSINLSEYYLNGLIIVFLLLISVFFDMLLSYIHLEKVGKVLIILYVGMNIFTFFAQPVNRSGFLERSAIVQEIKEDSLKHGYPCVAVSYITSPGNNLGYRYLFYLAGVRANLPQTGAPVYSIVFPLKYVDHTDKNFGALGLIYPDYARYSEADIQKSCSVGDQNLSEPLFGFAL